MVDRHDKRTSATRVPVVIPAQPAAKLASSASAARPLPSPLDAVVKPKGHGRSRSWFNTLLKPKGGANRLSLQPAPTPPPRPAHAQTAPSARTGSRRTRVSVSVDFKGKENVAFASSPVLRRPSAHNDRSSFGVPRSGSYLDVKPLPLDGEQRQRLESFAWDGGFSPLPLSEDKGKRRAVYLDEQEDEEELAGSADASLGTVWKGFLEEADTSVDELGNLRASVSQTDAPQRFSMSSDTPSTIAFPGPAVMADLAITFVPLPSKPRLSRVSTSGPSNLSPIPEAEAFDVSFRNPFPPAPCQVSGSSILSNRPVLHIEVAPSRRASAMSNSVYSLVSEPEDDLQTPVNPTSDSRPELASYFSPISSPENTPLSLRLEGLAISGADLSPSAPASPASQRSLETTLPPAEPLYAPLPLSKKPSFSAFRFPSTSSTSSSDLTHRAPSILDEHLVSAPSSTMTVATSVFTPGSPGSSTTEEQCMITSASGHERGEWRTDWAFSAARQAELALGEEARGRPVAFDLLPTETSFDSTRPLKSPAPVAPGSTATPPSGEDDWGTVSFRSSRSSRRLEKALPPVPDTASIFSGSGTIAPDEEVVRIEVYCQRELVRRKKERHERYVIERTLLYGEAADDVQFGTAV
ncbi:proteophosphoglycan ppg4 [Rhodotorula toruloides]|uniref:Proteophosphoglycan ppg4 n=1 Tax=Rhodotorula toruloides TaxID=5286 RepID=A0A511KH55_RHOTO|nr:proteophosphoglycan ppg4 [Rhodotorula toruloides]